MKLVDTSCWVHQIRRQGDRRIRERVETLLRSGEAAWCAMVRLELWNGVGSERDRQILRSYSAVLPDLPISEEVWELSFKLADECRKAGQTVPVQDVLIYACARHHRVELEHADRHYEVLQRL